MHIFLQQVDQFKTSLKLEYFYNTFVILLLASILFLATLSIFQPIDTNQRQQVIQLAQQATYPKTQHMAQLLLQHAPIQRAGYFKLMQGYQFEQARIKHYPAIALEDGQ